VGQGGVAVHYERDAPVPAGHQFAVVVSRLAILQSPRSWPLKSSKRKTGFPTGAGKYLPRVRYFRRMFSRKINTEPTEVTEKKTEE